MSLVFTCTTDPEKLPDGSISSRLCKYVQVGYHGDDDAEYRRIEAAVYKRMAEGCDRPDCPKKKWLSGNAGGA